MHALTMRLSIIFWHITAAVLREKYHYQYNCPKSITLHKVCFETLDASIHRHFSSSAFQFAFYWRNVPRDSDWKLHSEKRANSFFLLTHLNISSLYMYLNLSLSTAEKNGDGPEDLARDKSLKFWGILSIETVFGK